MVGVGHAHEDPVRMICFRGDPERCYFIFFHPDNDPLRYCIEKADSSIHLSDDIKAINLICGPFVSQVQGNIQSSLAYKQVEVMRLEMLCFLDHPYWQVC